MNFITFTPDVVTLTAVSSLIIIATYIISFCLRHGVPDSISASFYMLQHHILFSLTMWLTALLLLPGIITVSAPHTQWIGYVSIVGLLLVGATPRFRDKHQRLIHDFGAGISMFGTAFWVAFNHPAVLLLWIVFVMYEILHLLCKNIFQKPIFVVEILSFATFYTALFSRLLAC